VEIEIHSRCCDSGGTHVAVDSEPLTNAIDSVSNAAKIESSYQDYEINHIFLSSKK
jgi:hypothetical protein